MMEVKSLKEIIEFNSNFKTAINLYLSLNKSDKVLNYIPTKSSVGLMDEYLRAVISSKEQATLLVGPYGKGKSHLLLVLLAILSMERTEEKSAVINKVISKIRAVDEIGNRVADNVQKIWNEKGRFLPVILNDSKGDLNQAFLFALNDALKRENLSDIAPDTFYSIALKRLDDWENDYPDTFDMFSHELSAFEMDVTDIRAGLKQFSKESLDVFSQVYPKVTAGSEFNPLAVSEVFPLYKNISEKLVEDYGFSGIYIVFDEFSKFIEGQDGRVVGSNMKLLQDICELAIDSQNAQVFITMVAHKSIKEYGKYLSKDIINSFTGIEGRIIEKLFITSSKNNYELVRNAIIKDKTRLSGIANYESILGKNAAHVFYQLPAFRSNFDRDDFVNIILQGCYPLNPIAAYLLLNVSEKVAQNERTIFTFISNDEPNSMARFVSEHTEDKEWSVGADLIYDYFSGLFKKEVTNELVHNTWLGAEYALSKCTTEEERKIIKALAIIAIVNKEDEIPADDKYLSLAVCAPYASETITELVKKDLIYRKGSTGAFVFKTRAGSALKTEIRRQRDLKGNSVNYTKALESITGKYFVIPKKYNAIHMMTRYFKHEFMEIESFLNINSAEAFFDEQDYSDGKVITLFGFSTVKQDAVKRHFQELGCRKIVVIAPKKPLQFEKLIRDYEIIQELRRNQAFTNDNEILKRELPLLEEDIVSQLEETLSQIYLEDEECKVFYFEKDSVKNAKAGNEEFAVNVCCDQLYTKSPRINNEIINRAELNTAQTKKARLCIVQAILSHSDDETFFAGTNQEATIYRSLLCNTGIRKGNIDENLKEILKIINNFIDSCCDKKVLLSELVKTLTIEPYGMRAGVIPVYLAYALSYRREDLVVYFSDMEVAVNADIIINMCEHADSYALFVSKEDLLKEKYISSLNELFLVEDNRNLTDNRIKDIIICMQRWFRALPQVTRNTTNIGLYGDDQKLKNNMQSIKRILQKLEFNPYEMLFVSLPEEFDTHTYEDTFAVIDVCKTAFDDYFDWILQNAIKAIYDAFGRKRNIDLFHILKEWYDKQSNHSRHGLHDGRITNFMSCIENLNVYDDVEVAKKLVKAVTDVYIENWTECSYDEFVSELVALRVEIEQIRDENTEGKLKLSFVGRNGKEIERFYNRADEGTGTVLRNIIEDTLEEYDDLSVNDRVSILLEMIEKVIG